MWGGQLTHKISCQENSRDSTSTKAGSEIRDSRSAFASTAPEEIVPVHDMEDMLMGNVTGSHVLPTRFVS
jgi:hypothetical protein